ncbi:MAG TPA: ABC transporter permease subunit [Dongiaceae bacterium]|nr:ABC transporter permease subunit [Dongiaceae bacterium]
MARIRQMRKLKDQIATGTITAGGISIIFAICLIFFYLLYEILPLFLPASIDERSTLTSLQIQDPYDVVLEEQTMVGLAIDRQKGPLFFDARTGAALTHGATLPSAPITAFAKDAPSNHMFALGYADGGVLLLQHEYDAHYEGDNKVLDPKLKFPMGETPLALVQDGSIQQLAVRDAGDVLKIAALDGQNRVVLKVFEKVESFMSDEVTLEEQDTVVLPPPSAPVDQILMSLDQRWLFLLENRNQIEIFDLRKQPDQMRVGMVHVTEGEARITRAEFLLGGFSLLLADDQGRIAQWFMSRNKDGSDILAHVRTLELEPGVAITSLQSEHRRKGFVAGDAEGNIGFFNTTAERLALDEKVADGALNWIAMAPRGDAILFQGAGKPAQNFAVDNEHPEVSWSSLWGKVWYERYEKPDYIWQSSSANNDNEPKFSLMPITFGTLKAAFYAMVVAIPLSLCGAIYTAYFMAPTLRTKVKPAIELMGAVPTVILGFLAGLWLAPLVEANLPGMISILVLTPLFCLITAVVWSQLPLGGRGLVPDGWVPLILVPVVVLAGYISLQISEPLEHMFFGGNMRQWLTHDLGIDFDQRNSMIVGIAMGFAVIPSIFSIAEDAIFAVPKSLTQGSLALGATPWQTLVRVILPTASPGIFSALMIGLGRAVGETMIVLMATGNTPIMDMNIFEGLRTLSANIAVEMPEAEVGSSHFRILFLSGLVLFVFTFIVNTSAEIVRQRLRKKYGSL